MNTAIDEDLLAACDGIGDDFGPQMLAAALPDFLLDFGVVAVGFGLNVRPLGGIVHAENAEARHTVGQSLIELPRGFEDVHVLLKTPERELIERDLSCESFIVRSPA